MNLFRHFGWRWLAGLVFMAPAALGQEAERLRELAEQLRQVEQQPLEQRMAARDEIIKQIRAVQLAREQELKKNPLPVSNNNEPINLKMPAGLDADAQAAWRLRVELLTDAQALSKRLEGLKGEQRAEAVRQWQEQRQKKLEQLQSLQAKSVEISKTAKPEKQLVVPPAPATWNAAEKALWLEWWELRFEQSRLLAEWQNLAANERQGKIQAWQETHGERQRDLQEWVTQTMELDHQQRQKTTENKK